MICELLNDDKYLSDHQLIYRINACDAHDL